jgi:hypothetical protein
LNDPAYGVGANVVGVARRSFFAGFMLCLLGMTYQHFTGAIIVIALVTLVAINAVPLLLVVLILITIYLVGRRIVVGM